MPTTKLYVVVEITVDHPSNYDPAQVVGEAEMTIVSRSDESRITGHTVTDAYLRHPCTTGMGLPDSDNLLADEEEDESDEEEDESDEESDLTIRYRCPECGHKWEENGTAACDSECPNCGQEDISALMYKEDGVEFDPEQAEEWEQADRCVCGQPRDAHKIIKVGERDEPRGCKVSGCKFYRVDFSAYADTPDK
jgi:hypothetical protein